MQRPQGNYFWTNAYKKRQIISGTAGYVYKTNTSVRHPDNDDDDDDNNDTDDDNDNNDDNDIVARHLRNPASQPQYMSRLTTS